MQRQLFSAMRHCPFGCRYCFAKFRHYEPQPEFSVSSLRPDCSIIYPNCDGELLLEDGAASRLRELAKGLGRPAVISFSTKSRLTQSQVEMLAGIQRFLVDSCQGFLKVSISFSNISRISSIEPGAATLEQRLRGLELLREYEIPRAVTIKPILPVIAETEYRQLIEITRPFTEFYLLGDLYLDPSEPSLENPGFIPTERREVSWLDQRPFWPVIEDKVLKDALFVFIRTLSAVAFHAEPELLLSMWEMHQGGCCGRPRVD